MKVSAPLVLLATLISTAVYAGPADYVYMPTVEHGEREIDFKSGSASYADGQHRTDTLLREHGTGQRAGPGKLKSVNFRQEEAGGSVGEEIG